MQSSHRSLQRVFQQGFTVRDIARPLLSFDDSTPAEQVRAILDKKGSRIAGIRTEGVVMRVVEAGELAQGRCGDFARPIDDAVLVAETLPFAPLILLLKDHPRLLVTALGQIGGVIERTDLLQPPARMWLFGMVTLIEMRFNRMLEVHCPGESWKSSLSEGRLQKARLMLEERSRRNQTLTLADCLQFSDKTQIIARNEHLRRLTRFESRRQTEEVGKHLEKLRNNLAHSQDIVTNDWDTIVALAENLDSILEGPPGGAVDPS
jgi:hypothetical protein